MPDSGAVLVLHGFTANARTVEFLSDRLDREGLPRSTPVLRGHGTRWEDLRGVRGADWLEDAERAYAALKERHGRVVIVGHSVGGLVAGHLAAQHPEAPGLVLIAPAIRYVNPAVRFLPVMRPFLRSWPAGQPSVNDPELKVKIAGVNYERFPITAFEECFKLSALAPEELGQVRCPALVIMPRHDQVIQPVSGEIALRSLGSAEKRLVWLERSNHEVFWDSERALASDLIVGFARSRLGWPEAASMATT
ncbi:MAG TPA: alpha/beta fold hydrolase [Deinococcales bacterium]|nr:alpha/beta fold hydrolase [Deinococcales bacterium]